VYAEAQRIIGARRANMAQYVEMCAAARLSAGTQKKWPRKPGPFVESMIQAVWQRKKRLQQTLDLRAAKPEIGEVTITHRARALVINRRSMVTIRRPTG